MFPRTALGREEREERIKAGVGGGAGGTGVCGGRKNKEKRGGKKKE